MVLHLLLSLCWASVSTAAPTDQHPSCSLITSSMCTRHLPYQQATSAAFDTHLLQVLPLLNCPALEVFACAMAYPPCSDALAPQPCTGVCHDASLCLERAARDISIDIRPLKQQLARCSSTAVPNTVSHCLTTFGGVEQPDEPADSQTGQVFDEQWPRTEYDSNTTTISDSVMYKMLLDQLRKGVHQHNRREQHNEHQHQKPLLVTPQQTPTQTEQTPIIRPTSDYSEKSVSDENQLGPVNSHTGKNCNDMTAYCSAGQCNSSTNITPTSAQKQLEEETKHWPMKTARSGLVQTEWSSSSSSSAEVTTAAGSQQPPLTLTLKLAGAKGVQQPAVVVDISVTPEHCSDRHSNSNQLDRPVKQSQTPHNIRPRR